MKRKLTCIVCPIGCAMTVDCDNGYTVEGNSCPRGAVYALNECTNPQRTLTTTVRCVCGTMLPVKTNSPIPKDKVEEAMKIINKVHPVLPISVGDVIIEDVFGSEVVATANRR